MLQIEKEDFSYEIKKVFYLRLLVSVGLLTIGAHSASARGYFSPGNPGGLPAASGYPLAHTPANQAWETNNAWANFTAQNRQVQVPNVSTGSSGSPLKYNAVTP